MILGICIKVAERIKNEKPTWWAEYQKIKQH